MIENIFTTLLLQATPTSVSLIERWMTGEGGVLGLSLLLNIVLFNVAWYLLKLAMKKDTEKNELVEKFSKESNLLFERFTKDILENMLDVTKSLTELNTLIKGKFGQ